MPRPLSLDLQRHVVDWRGLPWPLDWPALFGRRAPLDLEIGFGNGDFLVDQAVAHPERDHVGIELSWTAATRLFGRLHRAGVDNVRVLLADVEVALLHLFEPGSLARVQANHPCPWPKARHEERRLFAPDFLALVASRMELGAPLTIVTDHAEYAEWLGERLCAQTALASRHATTEVSELPGHRPTKYQLKAMAEGVAIHYFEWEKRAEPDRAPAPAHRDSGRGGEDTESMPTVTLRGPYERGSLLKDALPRTGRETRDGVEVACKLAAVYRREDPPMWLVEALVSEGRLRQEFGILVLERGPEELLVKLSGLGRPHPTYGVKRAVAELGRLLVETNADLAVARENVGRDAAHVLQGEA